MDVATFLGRYPPFDALPPERLQTLSAGIQIEHFAEGTVILRQSGAPADALYVIRKGAVELLDDGMVLDLLGEGEMFGQFSLLGGASPTATVRAQEDTLCYLIGAEAADELLGTRTGRTFVLGTFRDRLLRRSEAGRMRSTDGRYRPLSELIRRAIVQAPPETSVADAAATMAAQRVSSLLVPMREGWGILTDRDLRSRVLAAGRSPDTPIGEIVTFPVRTLPAETMAGEALLAMFAQGVHHFPVAGTHDELLGVVTDTDLMGLGRHTPFAIGSAIDRAATREDVVRAASELPSVVVALVGASADPVDVGRVVALVIDAMTRRLLQLGIDRLGDPPASWAWLALGSAARHEQALHTDQDHALAFEPPDGQPVDVDGYFAELAEFVTSGLEEAGIPRCRGDAMAVHPALRRSLAGWREALETWMSEPGRQGSVLSSIVYDYRHVAGPLDAEPFLDAVVLEARRRPLFLKSLGRRAIDVRPPTGFLRDLVVERRGEHAGQLDVKHGGITIIANLARVRAVAAGVSAKGTIPRLEAAAAEGSLDAETADQLTEAFRFLWEVRLRHEAEQVTEGRPVDDFVDPSTLGPVARRALKESFQVIARAQRELATEFDLRPV